VESGSNKLEEVKQNETVGGITNKGKEVLGTVGGVVTGATSVSYCEVVVNSRFIVIVLGDKIVLGRQ
jgi:hypothetical protein